MIHGFSVDVEDWFQTTIDASAQLTNRFQATTMKVLDVLHAHNTKATFFVLGLAARKAPNVVKEIARAGHEIQSHGFGHLSNLELNQAAIREDVSYAKMLLEDITGQEVYGYRAPFFSINESRMEVLDILIEAGYRYDSSIFPLKTRRYGIRGYSLKPHIVLTPSGKRIVEAPIACFDIFGMRLPLAGGGYFRFWPYWVIHKGFRQLDSKQQPAVVYIHPYEYDQTEMSYYKKRVSLLDRMHQGIGRKGIPWKISKLLHNFKFAPLKEVLSDLLARCQDRGSLISCK